MIESYYNQISVKESRGQPPSGTLEQAVKNGNFL